MAWSTGNLAVALRSDKKIRWHDALTGVPGLVVTGTSKSELWPFDIAIYPDGELVATDLIEKRLQRFAPDGTPLADVAAGYAVGPQFVAVVDHEQVGRIVVTAMWDGWLELRELASGNLIVRWPAEENGAPFKIADVGIDEQLRVYVLDARKRVLYRFDPLSDETPLIGATPTPSRSSCIMMGDKRAGPSTVVLGNTVGITLTLRADCPMADTGLAADIVLVVDNSSSMTEAAEVIRKALNDFDKAIDLQRHRLGMVVFRARASVVSQLSHEHRDLGSLLGDSQEEAGDGSSIDSGIAKARDHLLTAGNSSAIPIIILMSDGGMEGPSTKIEAQRTKDAGIQIFVVAFGSPPSHWVLRPIASSPVHYFATWTADDLYLVFTQLAHQITASRIGNLVINDALSADVEYVADSSFPPAGVGNGRVTWGRGVLPSTGITLSLRVRPLRTGRRIPTNRLAVADSTDADGAQRQFVFPIPYIEVVAPTPTPTITPTPTVTPTPAPASIYLPLVLREAPCQPELQPLDVLLILDASNSMTGDKLAAAQNAARAFVDMLRLGKDRVGLVTFSTDARLMIGLTTDGAAFVGAVDRIALSAGTRMDSGLALALGTMLASPRPDAKQAVVLLTDGRQDAEPQAAVDAAGALRRAGIDVLAVGLGGDADAAFLAQLVDDPRKVRHAGDATALAEVYRQIARELPCDRAVWWGGR
ncbi:MAG: VWA domain-containing protein [Ardenticatenales bacterium]|nr:VWA domain-containing protein [Ardenticatenales bacterium]